MEHMITDTERNESRTLAGVEIVHLVQHPGATGEFVRMNAGTTVIRETTRMPNIQGSTTKQV
jgi:hypothetical protein